MAKADRTPKKIAGLKLPKAVREAPAIKSLLSTPEGRKLLSDALIEGAAAAAAKVIAAHGDNRAGKSAATPDAEPPRAPKPAARRNPVINPAAPPNDLEEEVPQNVLMPEADAPVEAEDHAHRTGAAD